MKLQAVSTSQYKLVSAGDRSLLLKNIIRVVARLCKNYKVYQVHFKIILIYVGTQAIITDALINITFIECDRLQICTRNLKKIKPSMMHK